MSVLLVQFRLHSDSFLQAFLEMNNLWIDDAKKKNKNDIRRV